jgi:hypothetical protein
VNGSRLEEARDEELADLVLDFLNKSATKEDLARYFREHSVNKES